MIWNYHEASEASFDFTGDNNIKNFSFEVRSNDEGYLRYPQKYYHKTGEQISALVFSKGGPIIEYNSK